MNPSFHGIKADIKIMSKKQLLEFIPLTVLLISGVCVLFKVPFSTWVVALSGFFLASLYFYVSFWLFSEFSIPLVTRIIAGLFYSLNICAWMFCFLHWPLWELYSIISFIGFLSIIILSLFNNKVPGYKQLLYRCIFFIFFLSLIYGYRKFSD
jgi:hypothetical protein